MKPSLPTVRSIAAHLGLSRTTVSDALRGCGRVGPRTVERVRRAAADFNYRPNPLTGSVMSAMRRARSTAFHGTLAVVDLYELNHEHGPFHVEIVTGFRARAAELGFATEEFVAGTDNLTLHRLDQILQSRSVPGVLVLPSWYPPDLTGLEWSRYAGLYTDYLIERPSLHSVCADHYHLIITALELLKQRGYRRPGLLIQQRRDERIELRQTAAFRAFQATHFSRDSVPLLIRPEYEVLQREFPAWFRRHKPDVVLSHFEETIDWMEACGARVPETCGFVALNLIVCKRPCAGLDLQGQVIGTRAAEMLIGQIMRNERGLPEWPSRTVINARWVEGPTLRAAN